jgi:hypothetical protein
MYTYATLRLFSAMLTTPIVDTAKLLAGQQYEVYVRSDEEQLVIFPNVATDVVPISHWLSQQYGGDVAAVLKLW